MDGDAKKVQRPGTFTKGNKAASTRTRKPAKGIAGDVRKHRKVIVAGLLDLATNGTATAKARALSELARIGWGTPASAEQMGTVDRVGGEATQDGNSIATWHDRRIGTPEGTEDIIAMLKNLAGPTRTLPEQLRELQYGQMNGQPYTAEVLILFRQQHPYEKLEPPYLDVYGRIIGVIPGCLELPTPQPAPDVVAAPVEPAPHVGPPLVAVVPDASPEPPSEAPVLESFASYCWRQNAR